MKRFIKKIAFGSLFLLLSVSLHAASTQFDIDKAHSNIGFSVKHLMITNVKGEFHNFSGALIFDKEMREITRFVGDVSTSSVDTDNKKRDDHLASEDFFFSEMYPEMSFKMNSYEGDDKGGIMMGDLTIRGTTKPVTLSVQNIRTVKDFENKRRVGFELSGVINRSDYGLTWNKISELGGVAVGEQVRIDMSIQGVERTAPIVTGINKSQ